MLMQIFSSDKDVYTVDGKQVTGQCACVDFVNMTFVVMITLIHTQTKQQDT